MRKHYTNVALDTDVLEQLSSFHYLRIDGRSAKDYLINAVLREHLEDFLNSRQMLLNETESQKKELEKLLGMEFKKINEYRSRLRSLNKKLGGEINKKIK